MKHSLLIRNAVIHTMWDEKPQAKAILFHDGRVKWLGNTNLDPPAERVIDAGGRPVIPGLIDAHCHPFWMAQDKLQVDLHGVERMSQLLEQLRDEVLKRDPGEWVIARGVHERQLSERRMPTRDELDSVGDGCPVVVKRACGHALVANSRALALSGVTERSEVPFGGIIERNNGRMTGVLRETAATAVLQSMPVPRTDEMIAKLREVAEAYLACGVTSITEAAVGFAAGFDREWAVWESLRSGKPYPVRVALMPRLSSAEAQRRGVRPGGRDLDWQIDTLKFFADGTLGSQSAALSEPYANTHSCCGLFMQPPQDLESDIREARRTGWNIAVHAIGDRAIDAVATAFQSDSAACRLRIEHLGVPSAASLQTLARVGAIIVPQYGFLREMGDGFVDVLGPSRSERLYPGRSLLEHGLTIAGSSDAPATAISPFLGIAAAVERITTGGRVLNVRERLTPYEAIKAYTAGGAAASGHGGICGQLSLGAAADAVILDRDPFECSSSELRAIKTLATVVRGVAAYENWNPP